MRRVFPLLVLTFTPFLANCAESSRLVAPAGAVHSEEHATTEGHEFTEEEWFTAAPWWTPGDVLVLSEEETSVLAEAAPEPVVMVLGRRDPTPGAPPGLNKPVIRPHAVTIPVGGKVTFRGTGAHRLGIYDDGVKPQDIPDANPGTFVLYPVNRLFLQPAPAPAGITFTFMKPGKYLVLCVIKNHFFLEKQWGWVHVE